MALYPAGVMLLGAPALFTTCIHRQQSRDGLQEKLLPVAVLHDKGSANVLDRPGRREAARTGWHQKEATRLRWPKLPTPKQLVSFTRGFVVVEETDADGNTVHRERRRFANSAMTACRRAWFIGIRVQEKVVASTNPFARMGLKTRAVGQAPHQTPTATWEELATFRNEAKELGYASIATAALAAWEWLQREEHLFGAFEVKDYRPSERPDSVHVVHPKTGEEAWWPLFDAAGRPLFPEPMAELDAIKESAIAGHIFRRDHKHRRGAIPLPWITARGDLDYLRSTVKKIVRAAKLRDELSFSSFRHGGFTEGADADLTDAELRAAGRHRSARQLPTDAKRTRKQLVSVATKRRAERTKAAHLSE